MSEITYQKFELRGGSASLEKTYLIKVIEAASLEDARAHVAQTFPHELAWIVPKSGNAKPILCVPVNVR
jgi:hypothetical protein